mgnify:CR=1 FL=1
MGEAKRRGSLQERKELATNQHSKNEEDFKRRLKYVEDKYGIQSKLMRETAKILGYKI